jgi:hypothetical protein
MTPPGKPEKAMDNSEALIPAVVPAAAITSHRAFDDEWFVVMEGRAEFLLDGAPVEAGLGQLSFLPKEVPHTNPPRLAFIGSGTRSAGWWDARFQRFGGCPARRRCGLPGRLV